MSDLLAGDLESAVLYRALPLGPAVLDELELWQIGVLLGMDMRDPLPGENPDPEVDAYLAQQQARAMKAAEVAAARKAKLQAAREKGRSEKR